MIDQMIEACARIASMTGDGVINGHMMGMHGMAMPGMVWMMLTGLVLLAVLLVTLIALALRLRRGGHDRETDRAMGILRERLARGEIDREEYLDRLETLQLHRR